MSGKDIKSPKKWKTKVSWVKKKRLKSMEK